MFILYNQWSPIIAVISIFSERFLVLLPNKYILVTKGTSVKLNMGPNCHGFLSEESSWQYNDGWTNSQCFVNICRIYIMYKTISFWIDMEDFSDIYMTYGHSYTSVFYTCNAFFHFVSYCGACCTSYLDCFSKFFKISAVLRDQSSSNWNKCETTVYPF